MEHQPQIEQRSEQSYVGKRVVMPMSQFQEAVPALAQEVTAWLDRQGGRPAGRPFLRYHVIDMPDRMDVEVGVPVNDVPAASEQIAGGTLPAGRYATLTYTGVENGVSANKKLIEWIDGQDEKMVCHKSEAGDAFTSRYETALTDPQVEPDLNKWDTQIAIKLRD